MYIWRIKSLINYCRTQTSYIGRSWDMGRSTERGRDSVDLWKSTKLWILTTLHFFLIWHSRFLFLQKARQFWAFSLECIPHRPALCVFQWIVSGEDYQCFHEIVIINPLKYFRCHDSWLFQIVQRIWRIYIPSCPYWMKQKQRMV